MTTSRLLPSLWASFDQFLEDLDEMPQRFLSPAYPPLNVHEDADGFRLEAELPGLSREQVSIEVTERRQVTISGERPTGEREGCRWHRRERGLGAFKRTVKLPAPVDADKVEAKLENGILTLTLPKAEEAKPRRIAVKSE